MDLNILIKKLCDDKSNEMRSILSKTYPNSRIINQLDIDVNSTENNITINTNFPDYAIYVDGGRKKGKQPPVYPNDPQKDAIVKWCIRKGIDKRAAFPIARHINKEDREGTHFTKPLKNIVKELNDIITKYYLKEIQNIFKNKK